ncbi:MAG: NAD(P)-dependent alcohol dehydrogenase [Planctomycetes bacterium]|nr:NAD(P)-dependent alcohol dehydrogenase [Planctomycetota bacterium]
MPAHERGGSTMRCFIVDGSGPASLQMVERPDHSTPGRGEVLVEVHAVSLNYRDLLVADGRYGGPQNPPIIACSDMAGVVAAVGPGVFGFKAGNRVLNAPFRQWPAGALRRDWSRTFVGGQGVDGVLAEQIIYPADALVHVPSHMTLEQGSTLTIAGLTAWGAMVTHSRVRPGDWVLAHGTGGVAIFAAQLAKLFHARAILSTSSLEKGRLVRERFGVVETIDYRDPQWPKRVREITGGRGVDVVVETAGGEQLGGSIESCNYGARVGLIGVLGGMDCKFSAFPLMMHQVTIRGIYMESAQELQALALALEEGKVEPCVDRVFSFEDAPAAYDYLRSGRHLGKVVIQVRKPK